jgi:hypothetical protein
MTRPLWLAAIVGTLVASPARAQLRPAERAEIDEVFAKHDRSAVVLGDAFSEEPPTTPESGDGAGSTQPAEGPSLSSLQLEALSGAYYSEELQSEWRIALGTDGLRIEHPSGDSVSLSASSDHLLVGRGLELTFTLDGARASGFRLGAGRVRNLLFERVR